MGNLNRWNDPMSCDISFERLSYALKEQVRGLNNASIYGFNAVGNFDKQEIQGRKISKEITKGEKNK